MAPNIFDSSNSHDSSSSSESEIIKYQQMFNYTVNNLLLDHSNDQIPRIIKALLKQRSESSSSS